MEHKGYFYQGEHGSITVRLPLFLIVEEENQIIYCPPFDLSGYGKTVLEAKESFQVVLDETIKYMMDHNTMVQDLQKLGWSWDLKGENPKLVAPSITDLVQSNQELAEIINNKTYYTYHENFSLPAVAA